MFVATLCPTPIRGSFLRAEYSQLIPEQLLHTNGNIHYACKHDRRHSKAATFTLSLQSSFLADYTTAEPSYISLVAIDCPSLNTNDIIMPRSDKFSAYCVNIANGDVDGTNPSLFIDDFVGLFAYLFNNCLIACSNANCFANINDAASNAMREAINWPYDIGNANTTGNAKYWFQNARDISVNIVRAKLAP